MSDSLTELERKLFALAEGSYDYNSSAEAMVQAALEAFNFMASHVGATGFQASWAALRFYGEAMHVDGPFMIVQLHDAVFPQYDLTARVQEFIDENRGWLVDQAREKLAEYDKRPEYSFVDDDGVTHTGPTAHPNVVAHWRKLAAAEVSS